MKSPKTAPQNEGARCPCCGREWEEAKQGDLALEGPAVMDGIKCDPDPSPRSMAKMIIAGACGAVTGGTILAWLRIQQWFWDLLGKF